MALDFQLKKLLGKKSNNSKLQTGINYLQTGKTSLDYRQLARQDATNEGISADLFEKQIVNYNILWDHARIW